MTGIISGSGSFDFGGIEDLSFNMSTSEQFERLLKLLELTNEEREFVRAALSRETHNDFFLVLADYLEERDKSEASSRFRKMGTS